MSARREYLDALAASVGVTDPDRAATHVRIEDERAGSNLIVGYVFDSVAVVRAGPEHADLVAPLASSDTSRTHDELRQWALDNGWVDFDGGLSHVVDPDAALDSAVPDGLRAVRLDPAGDDHERVVAWFGAADPQDVDAGDFDVDELDDRMFAIVDDADEILGIASSYESDEEPRFEDIGVIVAPEARGRGVGRAVVRALLDDLHADDHRGLYRCNWSNPASRQLALGLGFEEILRLIALCPEGDPKAG